MIEQILAMYNLSYVRILPPQKGYRNQSHPIILTNKGDMANLILYKKEPGILTKIQNANEVAAFLGQRNMPVRQLLDPRIITLRGNERQQFGALYSYLPGKTIPWEAYTQTHIKQLGEMMSNMHDLLSSYNQPLPDIADECLALTVRMTSYFNDIAVGRALATKLGLEVKSNQLLKMAALMRVCGKAPRKQALHMDFVRGNILFNDHAEITGIIDFEKTAYGHHLFDVARTLAFLIVDCKYKSEASIRKYFLYSGYQKRGAMPLGHTQLLEPLISFFLLYDFYKFLRHNPYESLPRNEHFTRTQSVLLKRNIIAVAQMVE